MFYVLKCRRRGGPGPGRTGGSDMNGDSAGAALFFVGMTVLLIWLVVFPHPIDQVENGAAAGGPTSLAGKPARMQGNVRILSCPHLASGSAGMSPSGYAARDGIRFAALPGSVDGYGGRGVDGDAYRSPQGYLFTDSSGERWWIVFQPAPGKAPRNAWVRGDVLACSAGHGEAVHVWVLAKDVLREDADAAFRDSRPSSYENAAGVAAGIPRRIV
jgi:hypothetical protein